MPHAISWDAAFEASPVSTDQVGQTPDFIRDTRGGAAERLREEHSFRLTDTTNNNQGKHRQGSARAFVNDTNPSTPDTLPADNGEYYVGRLLYKPTTRKLFIYANSAWLDAVLDANGDFTATRDLKATRNVVATSQLQSSVATGTAPLVVASTTKVTNLNADLLDGLNTGNASGNIPISNGTLNTNLNADMLEGLHGASAATANTAMLRDANGRSKVAEPSASDDIARLGTPKVFGQASATLNNSGTTTLVDPGLGQTAIRSFGISLAANTTRNINLPATGTYTYGYIFIGASLSHSGSSSSASAAGGATIFSKSAPDYETVSGILLLIFTRIA